MLSFMREPESQNGTGRPSPKGGPPRVPTMNVPETQEFLTVAANGKSLRRSTTLVVALVVVGVLCLLVMIRRSQPQAASGAPGQGDQAKIEAAISRLTGVRSEMADRMGEIVDKFNAFSDVAQVRVGELVKNPFEEEGGAPDLSTQVVTDAAQDQSDLTRRMEQQARTLKLLSIMRSDQGNSCMINDQILGRGETIAGFTVVEIGTNSVELACRINGGSEAGAAPTEEMKILLKLSY